MDFEGLTGLGVPGGRIGRGGAVIGILEFGGEGSGRGFFTDGQETRGGIVDGDTALRFFFEALGDGAGEFQVANDGKDGEEEKGGGEREQDRVFSDKGLLKLRLEVGFGSFGIRGLGCHGRVKALFWPKLDGGLRREGCETLRSDFGMRIGTGGGCFLGMAVGIEARGDVGGGRASARGEAGSSGTAGAGGGEAASGEAEPA